MLDEDGAEEEEDVDAIVLRSWSDDNVDRFPHVLQSEWHSATHTQSWSVYTGCGLSQIKRNSVLEQLAKKRYV